MSNKVDPARTAFVLIDPQNWTLSLPLAPHAAGDLTAKTAALIVRLKAAGGLTIVTRAAFSDRYADMIRTPVDIPLKVPEGGFSAEALALAPAIADADPDIVVTKRQWSAFYGTELDLQLRRRGIETVLLGGVMTNFGVESTARDAWQHNYATVVLDDCCSSLSAEMHRFSIEAIVPRVARVWSTKVALAALD